MRTSTRIQNVAIQGKVLSGNKQALDQVIVTAMNLATGLSSSAAAREDGSYYIGGLRSGEYIVCAAKSSYGEACIDGDSFFRSMIPGGRGAGILVDRNRTINITLKPRIP